MSFDSSRETLKKSLTYFHHRIFVMLIHSSPYVLRIGIEHIRAFLVFRRSLLFVIWLIIGRFCIVVLIVGLDGRGDVEVIDVSIVVVLARCTQDMK